MPALAFQPIELATLLPGARLVTGQQNVEETWKAEVYAETGPTIAYVKMLEPQQVISEVVCSLVGSALGLNIPKPFLVYVERNNLPQSKKWNTSEERRISFGSEDARHPSFRQWIQANGNAVFRALVSWNGFAQTAWLDEWIANDDRNVGNLLFDGNDFWLIDHSHALTGPQWTPADLRSSKQVGNRFLDSAYV